MAIELTEKEEQFLNDNRGAGWSIDETVEIPSVSVGQLDEEDQSATHGCGTQRLGVNEGRYIKFVHEYSTDKITIYEVYDPPAEQTAQEKLAAFLASNPDVQSLIGL
jgi:hypothetical protein